MVAMTKRNIKVFLRNKVEVFFSMLGVLLVIGLFALFLGNHWGDGGVLHPWLMAGVLALAAFTVPLSMFDRMVADKGDKTIKGFYVSPIKRSHITASYMVSALLVSMVMAGLTAVGYMIFFAMTGVAVVPIGSFVLALLVMALTCVSGTAMTCFIASLMKKNSTYTTVVIILNNLAGFVMGIYIPMGQLPQGVQTGVLLFPPTHGAMLLRRVLLGHATTYYGLDLATQEHIGMAFRVGEMSLPTMASVGVLVVSAVVFFALAVWRVGRFAKS